MINLIASLHIPKGSGLSSLIFGLLRWIYNGVHNYGVTIILFTVILRLIVLPMDFGNKYFSKKNAAKMAEFKDEDAELKKQYSTDPMKYMAARRQMYRKNGFNPAGTSIFMLANIILTLFIFFTVFSCLRTISSTNLNMQYRELGSVYIQYTQDQNLDTDSDAFRTQVNATYTEYNESFLWVHNIFRPDTWASKKPTLSEFYSATKNLDTLPIDEDAIAAEVDEAAVLAKLKPNASEAAKAKAIAKAKADAIADAKADYITQMHKTIVANLNAKNKNGWNGCFILIIAAAVTMYFSTQINMATMKKQKTEESKKEPEVSYSLRKTKESQGTDAVPQINPEQMQKIMKFMLPGVMIIATFSSNAAFALYITAGSVVQTTLGFGINFIVDRIMKKQEAIKKEKQPDHPVINPHSRYFKKQYE